MRPFTLGQATFAALATGGGGAVAVTELYRAKLNENLLLLRHLIRATGDQADLAHAFAALSEAQRHGLLVIEALLGHPWTGVWLAAAGGRITSARDNRFDIGRLGALAAVAAARTGGHAELRVGTHSGEVMLPDVGVVSVGETDSGLAPVIINGPNLVVGELWAVPLTVDADSDGPGWRVLHRLRAECDGQPFAMVLDDLDPLRDCHGRRVAPRLPAEEVRRWQRLLQGAWELLVRHAPERAGEVAAGLSVCVPLTPESARVGFSATSSDVFGGFALTRPASSAAFAATLVHELQHSKLNVLLRLHPLYADAVGGTFFAPWRKDPRPLGGLLHGLYAFAGVAELWHRLRTVPEIEMAATAQFARLREELRAGFTAVGTSGLLTRAGQSFAAGLGETIENLLSVPVPARLVRRARAEVYLTRLMWSLRNRSAGSFRRLPL